MRLFGLWFLIRRYFSPSQFFLIAGLSFSFLYWLTSSLVFTLYILFTLLYIISQGSNKLRNSNQDIISESRKHWLKKIIEKKLTEHNLYNHDLGYYISNLFELPLDDYYKLELSLSSTNNDQIGIIPDLLEAEKEILDQNMRISKILVILVFVPIFYYLIHVMYPIGFKYYILNTINLILLIENLSFHMRNPLQLKGWQNLYLQLSELKNDVIYNPNYFLYNSQMYFDNIYTIELSIYPHITKEFASHELLFLMIKCILNFNLEIRRLVVSEFIDVTKQIGQIEITHQKKWEALRIQFIYVTTSLILFLAILTSLFSNMISLIQSMNVNDEIKFINFNYPYFLNEFTLLITLILIFYLSQPYLSKYSRNTFLIIWLLEFLLVRLILDSLFHYLIFK